MHVYAPSMRRLAVAGLLLFTATLAWLVLGQTFSLLTYASLLPVAAGVALSAVSELQFSLFGFAAAMGSNA